MTPVTSDNVRAVGYNAEARVLTVEFRTGGTYEYYDVSTDLYAEMLRPHPWRRVGRLVRGHRYSKIGR